MDKHTELTCNQCSQKMWGIYVDIFNGMSDKEIEYEIKTILCTFCEWENMELKGS